MSRSRTECVAEEFPRFACCLVEAGGAAAWIVAWPERFEKFVAACRTPLDREVGEEFRGRLPPRLFLLAAGELERPEKQNTEALVARVSRCGFDGRRGLARAVPLKLALLSALRSAGSRVRGGGGPVVRAAPRVPASRVFRRVEGLLVLGERVTQS